KKEKKNFDFLEDAKEYAVADLKEFTLASARDRGAAGDITFSVDIKDQKSVAKNNLKVYTGTVVTVAAIGKMGF
ncbi:MAG: hypothetical protein IKZ65_07580, partial [Lachnospiraceae bacterium]|nr:hypothetical protein [Lachnospiraceae bacterium]